MTARNATAGFRPASITRARYLALFNQAIVGKFRGCDVVLIRVEDVAALNAIVQHERYISCRGLPLRKIV
jgi:hypothetical protein